MRWSSMTMPHATLETSHSVHCLQKKKKTRVGAHESRTHACGHKSGPHTCEYDLSNSHEATIPSCTTMGFNQCFTPLGTNHDCTSLGMNLDSAPLEVLSSNLNHSDVSGVGIW